MKKSLVIVVLALILVSCQKTEVQNVVEQPLNEGWILEGDTLLINMQVGVPSVVQQSLFEAGIIPHPYLGTVENDLLWISDHPWKYTLHFDADKELLDKDFVELVFEGIDTYADVTLNGSPMLSANNMFREWKLDAKSLLKAEDNVLEVSFKRYDSTQLALYEQAVPRFPEKYAVTRKCGYQHGWDWAPKYKNVGLWKPVKLVGWSDARLENAYIVTKSANEETAQMQLCMDIDNSSARDLVAQLYIGENLDRSIVFHLDEGKQRKTFPFDVQYPKIWWPNEMGEQPLCDFEVRLLDGDKLLDSKKICTGIKTIEMIDEPDSIGRAFYFKVNGVSMYAKGANYIPEEMIETWMNADNTLKLIREAKGAHFNMLRVWGGGVYPSDDFFNICDSLGILVWEDFMYAGSMYPYDEAFLENVEIEAVEQVKRLASHPSLALWCGGNEISEGYYNWGWQSSLNWSEEDDKAMKAGYDRLFEEILPNAVAEFDGTRPYWPSSPSKGWGRPESLTEGDVHYWGVWWGEQPYEVYREKVGRFNSEYGYQSYPDITTLQKLDSSVELSVGCDLLEAHQKHGRGTKLIDDFIQKYYPAPVTFADYVYMSQLSQAYGMEMAIEAHRTAKPYNMGTLYWQLNDAWPVTSWSSIDYYGNKKALQFKLKELYAPVLLSLDVNDHSVFATSDLLRDVSASLKAKVEDFSGDVLFEQIAEVKVAENQNINIQIEGLADFLKTVAAEEVYVKLELRENNELLAERRCYLVYPKDLNLPKANVKYDVKEENGETIVELTSDVLAKDVQVYMVLGQGTFSDNFFDLGAGETKRIVFKTEKPSVTDFVIRCLNDF